MRRERSRLQLPTCSASCMNFRSQLVMARITPGSEIELPARHTERAHGFLERCLGVLRRELEVYGALALESPRRLEVRLRLRDDPIAVPKSQREEHPRHFVNVLGDEAHRVRAVLNVARNGARGGNLEEVAIRPNPFDVEVERVEAVADHRALVALGNPAGGVVHIERSIQENPPAANCHAGMVPSAGFEPAPRVLQTRASTRLAY